MGYNDIANRGKKAHSHLPIQHLLSAGNHYVRGSTKHPERDDKDNTIYS